MTISDIDVRIAQDVMGIEPAERYSTDMAAAWKIVEKLVTRFPIIHVSVGKPNGKWYCSFYGTPDDKGSALEADSAPMAICLAALEAVRERWEEWK